MGGEGVKGGGCERSLDRSSRTPALATRLSATRTSHNMYVHVHTFMWIGVRSYMYVYIGAVVLSGC